MRIYWYISPPSEPPCNVIKSPKSSSLLTLFSVVNFHWPSNQKIDIRSLHYWPLSFTYLFLLWFPQWLGSGSHQVPELADQTVEERLITFDWERNFHSFQDATRRGAFRPLCWVKTQVPHWRKFPRPLPFFPISGVACRMKRLTVGFIGTHIGTGISCSGLLRPQRHPVGHERTAHLRPST